MRPNPDDDVEVPGRRPAAPGRTLSGDADARTGVDPGGNVHAEALRMHRLTPPGARRARSAGHAAGAATFGTGSNEIDRSPADPDLAATTALPATGLRSRFAARPCAAGTRFRALHCDLRRGAPD